MNARAYVAIMAAGWLLGATPAAPVSSPVPTPTPAVKAAVTQPTAVVLLITPSGAYDLVINGATGQPVLTPSQKQYTQVIDMTCCPTPVPVPPGPAPDPTPVPSPLTERGKVAKAEADKVVEPKRAQTAQALATIYRAISKQIKAMPTVSPASISAAIKQGSDSLLTAQGPAAMDAWASFRNALGYQMGVISAHNAQGPEYAVLLDEFADGLDASAPQRAIDPAFWQFLLALIPLILALLKPP